ncbi:hypothetical protein N825_34200 [Skermanella stibiiresistens SB22]|uniref:DUF29 domain-containing protein n=1 Tax=Skermanella stibiiresistens SB22 TaxID=1385369 RepID=W9GPJ9_9PROT|nr:DUF29 domain-containing protein [Skermanella stibiiresistens]EWY35815.1 hypothetical protein N825_34200 [Skermanella stibiiresistens SB22]
MTGRTLYDTDFAAWTEQQADLLRSGQLDAVDIDHIAEEIESLGRSELRAMESALMRIVEHLLKLAHSPASDPRDGWRESVTVQRLEYEALADDNPGLVGRVRLPTVYDRARRLAGVSLERHDGLPMSILPATCPWTLAEITDTAFWPR